jgi:hypothetical protein
MKASDIIHFEENIFDLKKNDGVRKSGKNDAVQFKFDGIEITFSSRIFLENVDI